MGKRFFICLGFVLSIVISCKSLPTPSLHGYTLGESTSSFISRSRELQEGANSCQGSASRECTLVQSFKTNSYSGFIHCYKNGRENPDFCNGSISHYGFNSGKLVVVQFKERNTWQNALNTMVAQYGKPAEIVNGTGKLANSREAVWSSSGYRLSLNGFQDDPSKEPTVYVILQTPEHYRKAGKQQEQSQKSHDEILSDYLDSINEWKRMNSKLASSRVTSDSDSDFAVKSMIDTEELLLKYEVRDDESAGAIY